MVIEVLANSINNDKEITGIPRPTISHDNYIIMEAIKLLQFADDHVSFSSNSKDLTRTKQKFDMFCEATSSSLNDNKCNIITFGKIKPPINIKFTISITPECYLGASFNNKGLVSKISDIINSIKFLLICWKDKLSTLRARVAVIKSYILSKLNYITYLDTPTAKHIHDLHQVITWFTFSSNNTFNPNHHYKNIMAIDRATLNWDQGGISSWDYTIRAEAQKAWLYNIFLTNKNNSNHDYIKTWSAYSNPTHNIQPSKLFTICQQSWNTLASTINHSTPTPLLSTINPNSPIKLKEIYKHLIANKLKKPNTIRTTPGQQYLLQKHNIEVSKIFPLLSTIKDHKSKDTTFKLLARCLPHLPDKTNVYCSPCFFNNITIIFEPLTNIEITIHQLFTCKEIEPIKPIIQQLYAKFTNTNSDWSIERLNFNNLPHNTSSPTLYINLTAIILNEIWLNICKSHHQDHHFNINLFSSKINSRLSYTAKLEYLKLIKKLNIATYKEERFKNKTKWKDKFITFQNQWNFQDWKFVIPDILNN